jgi:hypothetical protein
MDIRINLRLAAIALALLCLDLVSGLDNRWFSQSAHAQGLLRVFPEKAELGIMVPRAYPEVALNGKLDRLSAGSLIRDLNNRIVLLNTLANEEFIVSYTREPTTQQIQFVWILNQTEFEREKERLKQKRQIERDAGVR